MATMIPAGFAITCTPQGSILAVLRDEIGLSGTVRTGQMFPSIVDAGSYQKAFGFLEELRNRHAAFNWVLNMEINGEITPLHFAGGLMGDDLMIVGARSRSAIAKLYDELMKISNEQMNLLRQTLKDQMLQMRPLPQPERELELFDELSRLNNELTTTQRELAKKNAELERLNDLKNQFLGIAAHDLRNPLSIILAYSEFLADEASAALTKEQREFLSIIQSSSNFMLDLVNNLLDVSRIENGKLELDLWLADLLDMVQHNVDRNRIFAVKKGIQLIFRHGDAIPELMLDGSKIEQVLNNLIGNAIKFSPSGTTIEVGLDAGPHAVLLKIADQGPGIPPEELESIFLPFTRSSIRSTAGEKGAGLGLSIVKRIVEGHRGRIWVESVPGTGSTFYVSLPIDVTQPVVQQAPRELPDGAASTTADGM